MNIEYILIENLKQTFPCGIQGILLETKHCECQDLNRIFKKSETCQCLQLRRKCHSTSLSDYCPNSQKQTEEQHYGWAHYYDNYDFVIAAARCHCQRNPRNTKNSYFLGLLQYNTVFNYPCKIKSVLIECVFVVYLNNIYKYLATLYCTVSLLHVVTIVITTYYA